MFGIAILASAISTALVMLALGLPLGEHRVLLALGASSQAIVLGSGFYAWHALPFVACLIAAAVILKLRFVEGWVGVLGPILLPLMGALVIPFDYQVQAWIWRGLSPWVFFTTAWLVSLTLCVAGANAMIRAREARVGAA